MVGMHANVHSAASLSWPALQEYLTMAYETLQHAQQHDSHVEQTTRCHDAAQPPHTLRTRMQWYTCVYNACSGDPTRSRALYARLTSTLVDLAEQCVLYPLLQRYERVCARHDDADDTAANATTHTAQHIRLVTCDDDDDDDAGQDGGVLCDVGAHMVAGDDGSHRHSTHDTSHTHAHTGDVHSATALSPSPSAVQHDEQHDVARRYDVLVSFVRSCVAFCLFRRTVVSCFCYLDQHYTRRCGVDTVTVLCAKLFYLVVYTPLRELLTRELLCLLHDTRDAYEAAAASASAAVTTTDAHGSDGDDAAAAATRAQTCAQLLYDVLSNIHELLSAVKTTPSYTLTDTTTAATTATATTRTRTATMAAVAAPRRHASPSLAHARCNSDDMDASHNNNNSRSSSSRSSGGGGDSKTVSRASRAQQTSLTASPDDAHALPARSCSYTHSGDSDGNSNSRTAAAAAASMTRRTRVRVDVRATAQLRARLRDDVVAPLLNTHAQRYIERCVRASTSSGAGRMTTSHGHAGTTTTTATTTAAHLVGNNNNNNSNSSNSSTGQNELVASLVTDVRPSLTELVLCDYGNAYVAATTAYYRHACRVRLSSLQGRRGYWAWMCSVLLREHAMLCGARENNGSSADEARTQQQQQQQQQKAPSSHTMLWQRVRDALLRVLLSDVHRRLLLDDACGLRVLLDAWYGNGDDDDATLLAAAVAQAQVTAITVTADTSTTTSTTTATTSTTAMNSSSVHTRRALAEVAMHNMYVMLAATHEEAAVLLMAALVASKVLHSAADALFAYVQQQQQQQQQQRAAQQPTTTTCTSHVSTDGASVLLATRLLHLSVCFSSLVQTHMAHDTLLTSAVGDALCEVVNSARWCSRAAVAATTTATEAVVTSLRDTNVFASLSSSSSLPSVLLSHDAGARAMAPLYAVARAAAAAAVTAQRTQQQQHGRRRGNGSHDDNNSNVNSSTSSSYALPLPLPSLGRTLLDWCDDYAMHAQPPPPRHRASSDDSNNSNSSKGTVRGAGDDQDDDVVVLLAHVARLVGYLDDAPAFVDAYQQRLSRRLLSLLSLLLSSPPSSSSLPSLRQRHRVCHLASADAAACDTLHEDEDNSSSNNNRSSRGSDDDIVMYVRERLRVERALVRELRSCMPLSNIVYRMHVMLRDVHTCAMHVGRHKTTTTTTTTTTAITTAPARVTCTSLRVCMLTAAHWPASLVACASSLSPVFTSATTTTAGTAAAASVHTSLLLPHTLLQSSWQAAVARFAQHDVRTHGQRNVQWLHAYTTVTLRYHRRRRRQQHSDAVYGSSDTADAAAVATSSCEDVAVDIVANTTQAAVLLTLDDDDCVVRVDDDTSSHRRAVAATVAATVAHTTTATVSSSSSSSNAADDESTRGAVRAMTGDALARRLRIPFAQLRPHLCALVQSAPQAQPPRRPQHERPHVLCDDGDGDGSSSSTTDAVCTPLLVVVRNGAVVNVAGNVQRLCSHDAFALRSSTTTTTAGTGQHQQPPQQRVTVVNVAYARLYDDDDAVDDGGGGDGGGDADDVDAAATRCAARTHGDTALAHNNNNNNNNSCQLLQDHATRVRQLEAVVMRLLKAHSDGTLAFDALQQSCVTQLRTAHHTPTRADVKHALERLIDRGFVRRRADNNAIYEYIA